MNIKYSCRKWLGFVGVILFTIHCSLFLVSCSENSDTEEEYAQWQEKNDAYIQKLAASSMPKYLTYSKNTTISGADATDYVYVEVLESGSGEPTRPIWAISTGPPLEPPSSPQASQVCATVSLPLCRTCAWAIVGVYTSLTSLDTALPTTAIFPDIAIWYSILLFTTSGIQARNALRLNSQIAF